MASDRLRPAALLHIERIGDRTGNVTRGGHACELDEPRATGEVGLDGLGSGDGECRLADATGSDKCHHRHTRERLDDEAKIAVSSDEAGGASRKVAASADGALRLGAVEACIVAENLHLELAQLRAGLDPELLDQQVAGGRVRRESVGLAADAVQRRHQQGAQALSVRVVRGQLGQRRDGTSGIDVHVMGETRFDRADPLLDQSIDCRAEPDGVEAGHRSPRPFGERRFDVA